MNKMVSLIPFALSGLVACVFVAPVFSGISNDKVVRDDIQTETRRIKNRINNGEKVDVNEVIRKFSDLEGRFSTFNLSNNVKISDEAFNDILDAINRQESSQ